VPAVDNSVVSDAIVPLGGINDADTRFTNSGSAEHRCIRRD